MHRLMGFVQMLHILEPYRMPAAIHEVVVGVYGRILILARIACGTQLPVDVVNGDNEIFEAIGELRPAEQGLHGLIQMRAVIVPVFKEIVELANLHRAVVEIMHKAAKGPKPVGRKDL